MSDAPRDAVEAHYDRFPYPAVAWVVAPTRPAHTAGALSYLLRRRADDAFRADGSIWIAGCGTQQAARWGLMLPGANVLATDVSGETLGIAEPLAREVGATGVRFERADLREPPGEGEFDFVVCTGVVHHLDDPAAGLAAVRRALRPNGAALIMVYSRAHRAPLDPLRRVAARLAHSADDTGIERALTALRAALDARCRPADRELLEALWARRDDDETFLADLLIHPRETSYDLASMRALLDEAGLRFVDFEHPGAWRLRNYTDDARLLSHVESLDAWAEAELTYDVAQLASPMLSVLVERDDAPERPAYDHEERLAMPMLLAGDTRELDVTGGRLRGERREPAYRFSGETIGGFARSGHGAGRRWSLPATALPVLKACDGRVTVRELCARFGGEEQAELFAMVDALSPADVGLLAPAW